MTVARYGAWPGGVCPSWRKQPATCRTGDRCPRPTSTASWSAGGASGWRPWSSCAATPVAFRTSPSPTWRSAFSSSRSPPAPIRARRTLFLLLRNEPGPVGHGEIWRLLTYALLHDPRNLTHLLVNMLSLYSLGSFLEPMLGRLRMAGLLAAQRPRGRRGQRALHASAFGRRVRRGLGVGRRHARVAGGPPAGVSCAHRPQLAP